MSLSLVTTAPARSEDEDAAYRADVVTRFYAARDWTVELSVLAEAAAYDRAHPGEPPLVDELRDGDADYPAAA
ncbi:MULTISPECIES: hypothetical protein [unclassified Streptomyces]|uniref:hypothetical protein n=1 Tax=unclassified Streptomyces TaxID=2593676 RepID=UPI0014899511|nr:MULTISPECIES: hypothetical protein [unclassified Streptomyces]